MPITVFGVCLFCYGIFERLSGEGPHGDGIAALCSGLLFIFIGIERLKSKSSLLICKKCFEMFYRPNLDDEKNCPTCSGTLDDMKGFYDRNPELRKSEKKAKFGDIKAK